MIEGVEGFKAKLELDALGDVGVLVEAEDEVFKTWGCGNVARRVSKHSRCGGCEECRIRGKVRAFVGPLQILGIADLIATIDESTGQVVLVAAGIAGSGTRAAGEFLTDEANLKQLADGAGVDWGQRNFEVVLSSQVSAN